MSTPVKVAAFVVAMVVSFLGARAVGVAVGPLDVEPPATAHDGGGHADDAGGGHADEAVAAVEPGGLAVSREGYTLRVVSPPRAGIDRLLRFVVDGPDGEPVTAY